MPSVATAKEQTTSSIVSYHCWNWIDPSDALKRLAFSLVPLTSALASSTGFMRPVPPVPLPVLVPPVPAPVPAMGDGDEPHP